MAAARSGNALRKNIPLLSKFEGAMVGAVLGDCLGSEFEFTGSTMDEVNSYFTTVKDNNSEGKQGDIHHYTDDTAMARSVASGLIAHKGFNATDMAKRFTYEFFKEPHRGYGKNVVNVFKQLKKEGYADPFGPARQAFDGRGSYGNGGAMRIVPAPLFGYNMDTEKLNELVSGITRLTHSEKTGVNGAMLQAHAVHQMLHHQEEELDAQTFLTNLRAIMEKLEQETEGEKAPKPYCDKLDLVLKYHKSADTPRETVIDTLGTDVSALESVVTATYCFLRGMEPVTDIQASSHFERCIIYAVTLGGDTDTIASMTGAIAGAYLGIDQLPKPWIQCCEGVDDARKMAQDLYKLSQKEEEDKSTPRKSKKKQD